MKITNEEATSVESARKGLGWSQMDVAVNAGVSIASVYRIEACRNVHERTYLRVINAIGKTQKARVTR